MVLWNLNVARVREGKKKNPIITAMVDKIGIGIDHDNYEEIIEEAEMIMTRHGVNAESASVDIS